MTISDIYAKLYSRAYYEKSGQKFKFLNSSLFLDRRANIPFVIHMLDGLFYLQTSKEIEDESLFRVEMSEGEIMLYGQNTDSPLWILE